MKRVSVRVTWYVRERGSGERDAVTAKLRRLLREHASIEYVTEQGGDISRRAEVRVGLKIEGPVTYNMRDLVEQLPIDGYCCATIFGDLVFDTYKRQVGVHMSKSKRKPKTRELIQAIKDKHGIDDAHLAATMGVSPGAMRQYAAGRGEARDSTWRMLYILAHASPETLRVILEETEP